MENIMEKTVIACMGLLMLHTVPSALAQTNYKIVDNADKSVTVTNGAEKETVLVIEDEVKFSISRTPSINKSQPPLQNNNISLKGGVFGLTINESVTSMLRVLGTPTSTYSVNKDTVLYSYGRNLWVVTHKGIVKKVTTENHWVSTTLTNSIAFDNRFNSDWLIEEKVGYETKKAELLKQLPEGNQIERSKYRFTLKKEADVNLDVIIDLKIINGEKEWLVNGFEYGYTDTAYIKDSSNETEKAHQYNEVIAFVDSKRKQGETITIEQLDEQGFRPIFDAYADNGDVIQVYGNHLVLNFSYQELSKLSVYESVFRNKQNLEDWKFAEHYFEQPSTEVKALYGDEVMGNDDYWQVFLDDAKYDLYFVENDDGTMMLAELEIEFF